ncbi:hypothetical protein [Streptomyces sp. NPDC097619]|uniref:hypothetical protein n=1 Tax=Streptomyces sp. NPDC097619 TaxID=3157228 RepID=UPI00332E0A16
MGSLLVMFGVFGAVAVLLIVVVLRRDRRRTHHAEGLLIEQEARLRAQADKVSFNSLAVHNSVPTMTDSQRRARP